MKYTARIRTFHHLACALVWPIALVTLGGESVTLNLKPGVKAQGAALDRFGLASVGADGGPVKFYFDNLQSTAGKP